MRLGGDSDDGEVRARLYRDGIHVAVSKPPAAFPVPGGTIEVAASSFGLKRRHFVGADGVRRQLSPDPASAERRRAQLDRDHPGLSRAIGVVSVLILVVAFVLGIPQIVEQVSQIPWVADNVGTFASPFHLPAWLTIGLVAASVAASIGRALRAAGCATTGCSTGGSSRARTESARPRRRPGCAPDP